MSDKKYVLTEDQYNKVMMHLAESSTGYRYAMDELYHIPATQSQEFAPSTLRSELVKTLIAMGKVDLANRCRDELKEAPPPTSNATEQSDGVLPEVRQTIG